MCESMSHCLDSFKTKTECAWLIQTKETLPHKRVLLYIEEGRHMDPEHSNITMGRKENQFKFYSILSRNLTYIVAS